MFHFLLNICNDLCRLYLANDSQYTKNPFKIILIVPSNVSYTFPLSILIMGKVVLLKLLIPKLSL